jgi:hypothetical protein
MLQKCIKTLQNTMKLYCPAFFQKLQKAKSEEDVKDAYIKALGLKEVQQKFNRYTNQRNLV